MNLMEKSGWTPFPNSEKAVKQARTAPQTPLQTEAPAYRLLSRTMILTRRELAADPLQLELETWK